MDIITLLIIVVIGCAIMWFFNDSKQVVQFVLAVVAIIWLLTVCGILPNKVHFH
jgi:hypothetical protein